MFPKIGVPKNGCFIMETLIKMDDLGGKPTIFGNTHMGTGILFTYIYTHQKQSTKGIGKYSSPMDPMGKKVFFMLLQLDTFQN